MGLVARSMRGAETSTRWISVPVTRFRILLFQILHIYMIYCVLLTPGTINWDTWLTGGTREDFYLMKLVVDNATLHNHLAA